MEDAILKCLPIPGVHMSAASSLSELRKLGASKLLQFCGMAMQCVYNNVVGMVLNISTNRAPKIDGGMTSFRAKVQKRLDGFCVFEVAVALSPVPARKYGADAMTLYMKLVDDKLAAAVEVMYSDLRPMHNFYWLLHEAATTKIADLTNKAIMNSAGFAKTFDDDTLATESKKKKVKTAGGDAKSFVESLFKNS
jgi:hypothetical protein